MATAPTISDLGKVAGSLQVAHIEAVGHGRTAGKVHCNGNILSTAGNITATTGRLTLGATTSQIVLGTTNTVTISSTAPAASRVLTIADPLMDCRLLTGVRPVVVVSAAGTTLTAAQSGGFVKLGGVGPYSLTLPAVASSAGLSYEIAIAPAISVGAITIAAGSACILGVIVARNATANTLINGTAVSNLILGTTSVQGDNLKLTCDGTNWFLSAITAIHTSITTS